MEHICFELENVEVTYLDKEVLKIERLAVHQFDRICDITMERLC